MKYRALLLAILALFLLHIGLLLRASLAHTAGAFSYPVDDAFIHLALARHIAFDGTYGIVPGQFSAASSSIVWPWLLAAILRVVGNRVAIPFVVNVAAACALIVVVWRSFDREAPRASAFARTVLVVAIIIAIPLQTLVFIGMEHTAHALVSIAFVLEAARVIDDSKRRPYMLIGCAAALVSLRYEGALLVVFVALLAAWRRRFALAVAIAGVGAAPAAAWGVYSRLHGGLLLPNSVVLKRLRFSLSDLGGWGELLGGRIISRMWHEPYLVALLLVTLAAFAHAVRVEKRATRNTIRLGLAAAATLAHTEVGAFGWFYRYEAYVVALDAVMVSLAIAELVPAPRMLVAELRAHPTSAVACALVALVATVPIARRGLFAIDDTPTACRNIFEQQQQSARFLGRYFERDAVALNDIGAVAYFGDQTVIDLMGLANLDIAKAKGLRIDTPLSREQVERFAASAPIAIIYDEWFEDVVPTSWVRLGRWRIESNRVCAFPTVGIYATSGDSVPRVLAALRDFSRSLPDAVHEEGRYVQSTIDSDDGARVRGNDAGASSIGVGDVLAVETLSGDSRTAVVTVQPDGNIVPWKLGDVKARGLTPNEVESNVQTLIAKVRDPLFPDGTRVSVRVVERHSYRFYVAGRVLRSGEFSPTTPITVGAALELAGAGKGAGDRRDVYVWREDAHGLRRIPFDFDAVVRKGDLAGDIVVNSRDIVIAL